MMNTQELRSFSDDCAGRRRREISEMLDEARQDRAVIAEALLLLIGYERGADLPGYAPDIIARVEGVAAKRARGVDR